MPRSARSRSSSGPPFATRSRTGAPTTSPSSSPTSPRSSPRSRCPLDAAMLQLSPPDRHGLCTLGTSVDAARRRPIRRGWCWRRSTRGCRARTATPWCRSRGCTPSRSPTGRSTRRAPSRRPRPRRASARSSPAWSRTAPRLQFGIGGIPDAVLARLHDKHDLGVHTEMFSDGLIDLVEAGVVTNRLQGGAPGAASSPSFVGGTQRLYDFVDDNPLRRVPPLRPHERPAAHQAQPDAWSRSTRRSRSTSPARSAPTRIGHRIFSGIGGQMDFIRGAALSRGGKPIIALPSTAARGQVSRIVSRSSLARAW